MLDDSLTQSVTCENCSASNESTMKFCSQCRFPVGGTEEEKTSFRLIVSSRKRLLSDANVKIKSAKTVILIVAGLFFIAGLLFGFGNDDFATMIVYLFLCVIYLILAAWSKQNPFGAILTAFIIYATLQVVDMFVDPSTIVQGIIIKIFVVAAFIKGVRSAHEAQGYLKELKEFKAAPVDAQ